MIDEKKIYEEANGVYDEKFLNDTYGIIYYDNGDEDEAHTPCQVTEAFIMGAQWAQKELIKSLWHDASEEPDAKLHAWLIMQTGKDLYETVKYGGYNEDGGQTWQQQAKKGNILRWVYLDDLLPKEGGEGCTD